MKAHSLAGILHQKDVEVRRPRLGPELPHCQRELTSMVGGVIREVLHQVHQFDLCSSKWKPFLQVVVGHAIYKLDLFSLDLYPLRLHAVGVGECVGMEYSVALP